MHSYIAICSFEDYGMSTGFEMAKCIQEHGYALTDYAIVDVPLIETDYATNSYHLMVASPHQELAEQLSARLISTFQNAILSSYGAHTLKDITLGEDKFDYAFKPLLSLLESEYPDFNMRHNVMIL